MHACHPRTDLSPFQIRSLRAIVRTLSIAVAVNMILQAFVYRHHPGAIGIRLTLALVSVAPIVASILLAIRYFRGENDEYLRMQVVESLLWGLAATLVADAFLNYLDLSTSLVPPILGSLSLDAFLLTTSIILGVRLRSYR